MSIFLDGSIFIINFLGKVGKEPSCGCHDDVSLVYTYRTSGGGRQRFIHLSDRPAGGGELSSQAFKFTRVVYLMPCFVSEFRYSGGKIP